MMRGDLNGAVEVIAPTLLGAVITHRSASGLVAVRISEVEAYGGLGSDPASHAHRGPTPRTEVMFAEPGTLYVYFIYGMHWCANVVCGPSGQASAVLLRSGEVIRGLSLARRRRPASRRDGDLARGPANLAAALGITGSASGHDLIEGGPALRLSGSVAPMARSAVGNGPRVGIRQAADRPWRWWIKDDPTVSRYRRATGDTPR